MVNMMDFVNDWKYCKLGEMGIYTSLRLLSYWPSKFVHYKLTCKLEVIIKMSNHGTSLIGQF